MFHTIITLAYILPNIYVFLRIWNLYINKGYKIHYTLIYIIIALIYPLSNLISERGTGFLYGLATTMANYILPFYLYLFLLVLVFDILLLINYLIKTVPAEKFRSTSFKATALSAIILISILIVFAGSINFKTIRTTEYAIEISRKGSKISHLRIAFAADFHLKQETDVHFVEDFVKKIAEIKPDILLFGGDIVEGDRQDEKMISFEELLKGIKTRYGTYTVLGNHEYYGGQDKGSFFDKSGMKVLSDTIIAIDSAFYLGGRLDSHFRARKNIENLIKNVSQSLPVILIDHRPTEIAKVSNTITDVQLSGHTHHGQLFPINLITSKVYELSRGYMKKGKTHFFVTSGIRLWGPPVRTVAKSEIMVINVDFI